MAITDTAVWIFHDQVRQLFSPASERLDVVETSGVHLWSFTLWLLLLLLLPLLLLLELLLLHRLHELLRA